ncbi:MAG TPA: 4-hydroxy-tetrahydrodipicolinate synthase [Candidatus Xenobia bacterium]|jgi:4-hydroxy-tetrahydrodipicolinate synthase
MTLYGNVMTAMVTPFNDDLSLNERGVHELARYLVREGSDGLIVCGTTGESPTLSFDEKIAMFRIVREAVGNDVPVWAGTGSNDTAAAVALTRAAEDVGADGVLVVTPMYNKPPQEGLYQYFRTVANATRLPVMVYNVPGRTGINLLPETIERLLDVPNIAAVKEAAGSLDQVAEIALRCGAMGGCMDPSRPLAGTSFVASASHGSRVNVRDCGPDIGKTRPFYIYSGDDSLTLPMLTNGAVGVVSVASHVVGPQMKKMVTAFMDGRTREAAQIHLRLFPVFKALFAVSNPILVKAALQLRGLPVGPLRSPLVEATSAERDKLRRVLQDAGVL